VRADNDDVIGMGSVGVERQVQVTNPFPGRAAHKAGVRRGCAIIALHGHAFRAGLGWTV
jgi:C-terminal processing protease CtpA/Prc